MIYWLLASQRYNLVAPYCDRVAITAPVTGAKKQKTHNATITYHDSSMCVFLCIIQSLNQFSFVLFTFQFLFFSFFLSFFSNRQFPLHFHSFEFSPPFSFLMIKKTLIKNAHTLPFSLRVNLNTFNECYP